MSPGPTWLLSSTPPAAVRTIDRIVPGVTGGDGGGFASMPAKRTGRPSLAQRSAGFPAGVHHGTAASSSSSPTRLALPYPRKKGGR